MASRGHSPRPLPAAACAAAALLLWLTLSACAPVQPLELSVLTYNVHGLPPLLADGPSPARRIPRIRRELHQFDVALIQEDFAYPKQLSRGTSPARVVRGPGRQFRWGHLATAPLWIPCWLTLRCGQPPIQGSGLTALVLGDQITGIQALARARYRDCRGYVSDGADCFAAKGYSGLRLTLQNGAVLDLYNTHLEAGNHRKDLRVRWRQIQALAAAVRAHSAGRAVVVAGDMNSDFEGEDGGPDFAPVRWLMAELGLEDVRARPAGAWKTMDYILYRPGVQVALAPVQPGRAAAADGACASAAGAAGEARCFVDPRGRPLSDHPALYARFQVAPRAWALRERGPGEPLPD